MTSSERIHDAFHDAAYVYVDEDRELAIVWNGSLTFNVYDCETLTAVDMWTAGDNVGDRWAAREQCERWMARLGDEDD